MLPLSIFSSSQFTATNVVTFIVYGAFGLVFLLVVVQLQVVAGYAPLTTTALASAPADHAGLASGVNNAVARTGGLLAVAAVPALAGLSGQVYEDPVAFDAGFDLALWVCVGLLAVGGALAALAIRDVDVPVDRGRRAVPHCTVAAPPLVASVEPGPRAIAPR